MAHIECKKLNPNDLNCFNGTERHYRLPMFPYLVYTDGVRYFANQYEMRWFITDVAIFLRKVGKQHPDHFYAVILKQLTSDSVELIFTNGDNKTPLLRCQYMAADFKFVGKDKNGEPIREMTFFIQDGAEYYCLMLPSEY